MYKIEIISTIKILKEQEGCDVVAHERVTEPHVIMKWLLAKPRSFLNLPAFKNLNGI